MLRTFLLFLAVGVASQILFAWTADASWSSDVALALGIFAPAAVAAVWWRRKSSPSFSFAALGIAASGLAGCGIYWWRYVRNFSCPPGDFECLTVGSQSGENFVAIALVTLTAIAFAAAGAFVGARSAPKEAI